MADAVMASIVVLMLLFVFAVYLFLRRVATGFKEGVEQARDNSK